ncbi:LLM class flavin-dependent oxidoreductase [Naasia lichenicola]|uniref:LLM class flavin-dependent oxidoreductase n=1 Tax=Naasia lichenicola TaxID=2565933 RepID=A0A4S4FLD2_9MICO|nr:LLM class flavin-dependent oxidoreductase [Naasia lichenicola]THG31008.1 LLM class flavin-dependent oxidoreductase [Naasia lichenicola]
MSDRAVVSLGIAASVGPELAGWLAPLIEDAGFHALWVNDTPGADAVAVLEAAARTTERLHLATGVLAVDRRAPGDIAAQIVGRRLPQQRLTIGIGSGQAGKGALELVRSAASALTSSVDARIVVGALGPKMREVAARASDGVLLSWLPPDLAREQAAEAHAVDADSHVALYVRAAVAEAAQPRLHEEAARYVGYPSYAANFARLGIDVEDTLLSTSVPGTAERLKDYRQGTDEVVLRAITATDSLDDYRAFIDEARTLL